MSKNSETEFLDFLKQADEAVVRQDPPGSEGEEHEPVAFSEVAQDSDKDGKMEQASRLLPQASKSNATQRAILGAVLDTKAETQAPQVATEKVSHPRSSSLMETVLRKCGRL
jgi:hypothetical protein